MEAVVIAVGMYLLAPAVFVGLCGGRPGASVENKSDEDFDFLDLLALVLVLTPLASVVVLAPLPSAREFALGNFLL